MRRTAPTQPVNAKMYRHFAVISLTLTAGLAMFANSGSHEALEDQIAEKAEAKKAAPKKIASNFKDNRKGVGSFGQEAGSITGGGGAASYSGNQIAGPELVAASQVTMISSEPDALPDGAVNGLPPGMTAEEIRAWQARHKKKGSASSEPSATDDVTMVAASNARSPTGAGY